jgi:hypothetical protein
MKVRLLFRTLFFAAGCLAAVSVRSQLLYVTNADGISVTITGYTNSVPNTLVIPANINGLTVTAIGGGAFAGISDLTGVTIPSTLASIGGGAFEASGLTNITIPYGVTNIDDGAFSSCLNLANLVISESVITIGSGAFSDCRRLTSVAIPGSISNLESGAFSDCGDLTNLVISFGISSLQMDVLQRATICQASSFPAASPI